jgi:hypothetical protein
MVGWCCLYALFHRDWVVLLMLRIMQIWLPINVVVLLCFLDGPVLKQTDLYLLGATMQVNPVLAEEHPDIKISE